MTTFISLPVDLIEEIFRSLYKDDSSITRTTLDIVRDMLSLSATCKQVYAMQKVVIHRLEVQCPKIVVEESHPNAMEPLDAVTDVMWDTLIRMPENLTRNQVMDMVRLLPATGLLQDAADNYCSLLITNLTRNGGLRPVMILALRYHFGIERSIDLPARIVASLQRRRRVRHAVRGMWANRSPDSSDDSSEQISSTILTRAGDVQVEWLAFMKNSFSVLSDIWNS